MSLALTALSLGFADAAVRSASLVRARAAEATASLTSGGLSGGVAVQQRRIVWEGVDVDGDGQSDVVNPTGHAPRVWDAYGGGHYGASRDGGSRRHAGVDYVATAGQTVRAPISGFVTKIGYVYPGDVMLRYVQIDNPALHLSARIFYVEPAVEVGQPIAIGRSIGQAQTLQVKYPGGITDHVHLEIADRSGRKIDPATMIVARLETVEFGD